MADKEIPELTAATLPLAGTETVHIVQGGNSREATLSDVAAIATGAMLKAEYDPDANGIIAVAQGGTNAATASGARTNLGLGTMAVQNAATVAITGGSVTGITDLTVADGGTGASDASGARTNLGLAIGTDVMAYSANLAGFAATTVANVQNRDNHTGTQLAATISDFSTAADARISAAIGATVQAYSALLDSVSDLSLTAGDIIYATGEDAVAVLPVGEAGQVLSISDDGVPEWGTELVVGGLLAANDLSDVEDAETARANLGLEIDADVQAYSANLDTLSGITPGTAGQAILADSLVADVRNYLDVPTYVADRTALKALDTTKDTVARLDGSFWDWTTGDFSAYITADVQEGAYAEADAIAATVGAWVRRHNGTVYGKWWNPPTYPGNASPMFKSIIDLINIDFSKIRTVVVDDFYNLEDELPTISGGYGTIFEADARSGHGFNKDYTASADSMGMLTFTQYAPCVRGVAFAATSGSASGSAISCNLPGPVTQNGRPEISNCEFSLGDHVNYNLYVNGLAATSGGTGYRTLNLFNCLFFGTAAQAIWLGGVKFVQAVNCQITTDGGSGTIALFLTGVSGVECDLFEWNGYINGDVNIDFASRGIIKGKCLGDVFLGADTSGFRFFGGIAGTFSDNGTDNWAQDVEWKTFATVSAPVSGTWTSASGTMRYREDGKTVHFNYILTITTNGTGAGGITFTVPSSAKTRSAFAGREVAAVGTAVICSMQASGTSVDMQTVSNTYPGGTGYIIVVNGTYEKA